MKKLFYLGCLLFVYSITIEAQNYDEVVYLKNGSILHGIIIEQIPNQSIKIQTKDGNVFEFYFSDIEKITKEQISTGRTSRNSTKTEAIPINPNARKLYPGVSFALSFLCPGAGQIYNGQKAKGGVMIGLWAASMAGIIVGASNMYTYDYSYYSDDYYSSDYETIDETYLTLYLVGFGVYLFDWTWSMISAPVAARRINRRNGFSYNYKLNKNIDIALKPDYKLNFGGKTTSVLC